MSQKTALVSIHASQLGLERKIWGSLGWRTIHRVVTPLGSDPDFEDVEVGSIRAGKKTYRVWRRSSGSWTTDRAAATRYAKPIGVSK